MSNELKRCKYGPLPEHDFAIVNWLVVVHEMQPRPLNGYIVTDFDKSLYRNLKKLRNVRVVAM